MCPMSKMVHRIKKFESSCFHDKLKNNTCEQCGNGFGYRPLNLEKTYEDILKIS